MYWFISFKFFNQDHNVVTNIKESDPIIKLMAIIKIAHLLISYGGIFFSNSVKLLRSTVGLFKGFVIKTKDFGATGGLCGDFGYKFSKLSDFDPNLRKSKLFISDFEFALLKFGLPNGLRTDFGSKLGDLGLKFGDRKELLGDLESEKLFEGFVAKLPSSKLAIIFLGDFGLSSFSLLGAWSREFFRSFRFSLVGVCIGFVCW